MPPERLDKASAADCFHVYHIRIDDMRKEDDVNVGQVVPHIGKGKQLYKMMKIPCLVNPAWGNTHAKMAFSTLDGTAV
ncbi:MAG: hypothetical protein IJ418_03055 [Clostridia bacterium]|nr:hypothetical protein [Clostridia bacterium]